MLTLPIKKKWFDMILSGEKKEEYREIKPYWITRFAKSLGFHKCEEDKMLAMMNYGCFIKPIAVMFKNGYSANAPCFIAMCTFTAGVGKEVWGAEKGKWYFILTINEITTRKLSVGRKAEERNVKTGTALRS